MSTKNRVGMLLAAAILSLVFAAGTSARAGDFSYAQGVWVGSWQNSQGASSRSSVIDFDRCWWYDRDEKGNITGQLEITDLQFESDILGDPLVRWEPVVQIRGTRYQYVVVASYDEIARILTINYAVYDFNTGIDQNRKLWTGSGTFRRP
jgi:hypothetical protein